MLRVTTGNSFLPKPQRPTNSLYRPTAEGLRWPTTSPQQTSNRDRPEPRTTATRKVRRLLSLVGFLRRRGRKQRYTYRGVASRLEIFVERQTGQRRHRDCVRRLHREWRWYFILWRRTERRRRRVPGYGMAVPFGCRVLVGGNDTTDRYNRPTPVHAHCSYSSVG